MYDEPHILAQAPSQVDHLLGSHRQQQGRLEVAWQQRLLEACAEAEGYYPEPGLLCTEHLSQAEYHTALLN